MWKVDPGDISVEVTYNATGLFVGLTVLDDTGVAPVAIPAVPGMVNGIIPCLNFAGFSYRGKFPGVAGHSYLVNKAVYTDENFDALAPNKAQGSETYQVSRPIIVGTDIVGVVEEMPEIHGHVEDLPQITGTVEELDEIEGCINEGD